MQFSTISKEISIEHDITNFNMAEFEKDGNKGQYDQSMLHAKLKRLENIAELKRANMVLGYSFRNFSREKRSLQSIQILLCWGEIKIATLRHIEPLLIVLRKSCLSRNLTLSLMKRIRVKKTKYHFQGSLILMS